MKSFFSNYAWLIASVAGGILGLSVIFNTCLGSGSPMSNFIQMMLEGLM